MKKVTTVFLCLVMVLSSLSYSVCAEENDALLTYKASDSFSETANGDGVWKWKYFDSADREYKELTKTSASVSGFGGSGIGGFGWVSDDGSGYAVGNGWMRPSVKSTPSGDCGAVREYEVPYDGAVTVTAEDMNGAPNIIGSANKDSKDGAYVRIVKNSEQVWPADNKTFQFVYSETDTDYNIKNFEPLKLNVKSGDKLYFEVYVGDKLWDEWQKLVYWNPVVTYNNVEVGKYEAANAFSASQNGGENWKWQ